MTTSYAVCAGFFIGGLIGWIIPFAIIPYQGIFFGVIGSLVGLVIWTNAQKLGNIIVDETANDDAHKELAAWSGEFRIINGRKPTTWEQIRHIEEEEQ